MFNIDNSDKVTVKLCKKLEKEGMLAKGERDAVHKHYIKRCTVEMFGELNGDDLIHLIMHIKMTRTHGTKERVESLRRGLAKKAKDGAVNKIKIAYECRATPNCVKVKLPFDLSSFGEGEPAEEQESLNILSFTPGEDDSIFPSDLLGSKQWVKRVIDLFDTEKLAVSTEVTRHNKDNVDLFVKIL